MRDGDAVAQALRGVDSVIHLAAEVGVGQSMYEVERYTSTNDVGTAVLFERLIDQPVRRVVTASSMSIYGEGLYRDADGNAGRECRARAACATGSATGSRSTRRAGRSRPCATPEWKRPSLASIYALNKYVQERTTHIMAAPYGIESVCLRLFNVYGPGQALSNPYTGVLAIFASRLLNGQQPMIFEDGEQRRDFVHVTRRRARLRRCARPAARRAGGTFNIGSGQDRSVTEVATRTGAAMGKNDIEPEIVGKARIGDIRHCFCDTTLAAERLGFTRAAGFRAGPRRACRVGRSSRPREDRVEQMRAPNSRRGGWSHERAADDPRPILVTGGAGFIGSNLADRLAARRARRDRLRCAVARRASSATSPGCSERHGEPHRARSSPTFATRRGWPTPRRARKAVFHMAAQVAVTTSLVDPREDFEINIGGTLQPARGAARRAAPDTPVIFASTNKVYGDLADVDFALDGRRLSARRCRRSARTASARSGRSTSTRPMAARRARPTNMCSIMRAASACRAAVLRMSCIYGQRQMGTEDQGWVAHFLIRALEGKPITLYGDGHQVRDILDVARRGRRLSRRMAADRRGRRAARSTWAAGRAMPSACAADPAYRRADRQRARHRASRDWRAGDQRYFVADTRAAEAALGLAAPMAVARRASPGWPRWLAEERGIDLRSTCPNRPPCPCAHGPPLVSRPICASC